jgi:hypothetical protein
MKDLATSGLELLSGCSHTGTILGNHSVAELSELLTAKDVEQDRIESAFAALDKSKVPVDLLSDWTQDWAALKGRYAQARAAALVKIEDTKGQLLLSAANTGAEDEWQHVLHALTRVTGHYQKGDVQDVYNRVVAMGAQVDMKNIPQPSASSDSDLIAFKQLDAELPKVPKLSDIHLPSIDLTPKVNILMPSAKTVGWFAGGAAVFALGVIAIVKLAGSK